MAEKSGDGNSNFNDGGNGTVDGTQWEDAGPTDSGDGAVDPTTAISGDTTGDGRTTGKKRGRKPGSKNAKKKADTDLKGIEGILFSTHLMMASFFNAANLAIDKEESERLAQALIDVGEQYDIVVTPKTKAWVNLGMTCGAIYGTRLMGAFMADNKPRRQATQNPNTPAAEADMSNAEQPFIPDDFIFSRG